MGISIYQIAAFGVVVAILSLILKKDGPAFSILISAAAAVMIFIALLPMLGGVMELLDGISGRIKTTVPFVPVVIKVIGIAYVSEFAAQLISDAGESAIAAKVELAGKILIMTVSAPIILALVEQVITMLP